MVYRSRRWRLLSRFFTLAVSTLLMLLFAEPATYALQDDEPTTLSAAAQLFDKRKPLDGAYITVRGTPDGARAFSTPGLLTTQYWIPVSEYGMQLLIRTDDPRYLLSTDYHPVLGLPKSPQATYTGKVMALQNHADAKQVMEELERQGIRVELEKVMFLSQGELPSAYRPIVPVMPVLAWAWLFAVVGLVQITRGRGVRLARAVAQAREM